MPTDPAWPSCTTACNGAKFAFTERCEGEVHVATPVGHMAPRLCRNEVYTKDGLAVCGRGLNGHDGRCGPALAVLKVEVPA